MADRLDGCDLCGGAHTNEQHVAHERRAQPCREDSCKKPIIWLKNPATGKTVPVDAETVEASDTEYVKGRHVSHFTTCTAPNRFSKGKR